MCFSTPEPACDFFGIQTLISEGKHATLDRPKSFHLGDRSSARLQMSSGVTSLESLSPMQYFARKFH